PLLPRSSPHPRHPLIHDHRQPHLNPITPPRRLARAWTRSQHRALLQHTPVHPVHTVHPHHRQKHLIRHHRRLRHIPALHRALRQRRHRPQQRNHRYNRQHRHPHQCQRARHIVPLRPRLIRTRRVSQPPPIDHI